MSRERSTSRTRSPRLEPGAASMRRPSIVDMLSAPPPLSGRRPSDASISDSAVVSDWADVGLSELVDKSKLIMVDSEDTIEQAFSVLESNELTALPVVYRKKAERGEDKDKASDEAKATDQKPTDSPPKSKDVVRHTFDYSDLNAYLLVVLGHLDPVQETPEIKELVEKARRGLGVPVKFVLQLGVKEPFVTVPSSATLSTAVDILGNGVHRLAVTARENPSEVIGVLSQRRVIEYIWNNGRMFKSLEPLFQAQLKTLNIGSTNVLSINGDQPVIEALKKMHSEGVSSLAVVDDDGVLMGNISVVDVRLVTKLSQSHHLKMPCKQFLSVILSRRGLIDGRDSYPVFHATPESTLGRALAKLVATRSHRLWIVKENYGPPSPTTSDTAIGSATSSSPTGPLNNSLGSGKLIGVVSLTDILYLLGRHAGKHDLDPTSARKSRRRSSSTSVRPRLSSDLRSSDK